MTVQRNVMVSVVEGDVFAINYFGGAGAVVVVMCGGYSGRDNNFPLCHPRSFYLSFLSSRLLF